MATEKRLIDAYAFYKKFVNDTPTITMGEQRYVATWRISDLIADSPTVDAVEVDKLNFKLHHILIDNEGVPEVKLQIGDRYIILHTDPVDAVEVVRCKDCKWVYRDKYSGCYYCHERQVRSEHFCSYGERRTDA